MLGSVTFLMHIKLLHIKSYLFTSCHMVKSFIVYALSAILTLKGNSTEKNVGLNEYLRKIKFCTGQESVDVVQRKKIFNDKNHYLFTYFKNRVLHGGRK